MAQYEYKTIRISHIKNTFGDICDSKLNKYGSDGWRLIKLLDRQAIFEKITNK